MSSESVQGSTPHQAGLQALPKSIWILGFVSLCMDTSSELIHSLLPVFLVSGLGASMMAVGMIEGLAEATASITRIFSGTLSDYFGKRKFLTVLGYGLAAATKPLFPLASSVGWVMAARFLDRIGKGVRGAPRDALVADIAPPHLRGACYGLRQSLDTVGAFAGPLLAIGLMLLFAQQFRPVFWVAVAPAMIAVGLLVFGVQEPTTARPLAEMRAPLRAADFHQLDRGYWGIVCTTTLMSLARFSEAFLVLRAQSLQIPLAFVPLVLVVMNAAYALSAYPAGQWSDRQGRQGVLAVGCVVLLGSDIVLGLATSLAYVMLGVGLWGLHMGCTHGLFAALVADRTPPQLRGTAFGVFHFFSGLAALGASLLAGWLWQQYGPQATFAVSAGFTMVTLVGVLTLCQSRHTGDCLTP